MIEHKWKGTPIRVLTTVELQRALEFVEERIAEYEGRYNAELKLIGNRASYLALRTFKGKREAIQAELSARGVHGTV